MDQGLGLQVNYTNHNILGRLDCPREGGVEKLINPRALTRSTSNLPKLVRAGLKV